MPLLIQRIPLKKKLHNMIKCNIVNLSGHRLPYYASSGAAGMDLSAHLENPILLQPLQRAIIPTGLFIELPIGYEAQIRSRSGLAANHGIVVLNSPGTIDSDYRGEIKIILINLSQEAFKIENGFRIAQLVVHPYVHVEWNDVAALSDTPRGEHGFGSSGIQDTQPATIE